jgi:hypothetical protein
MIASGLAAAVALASGCDGEGDGGSGAMLSCSDNPCDANATCTDLGGGNGWECDCNDGFAGDGETCCADGDGDEVCDDVDNCPEVANADQADEDDNGTGDACQDGTEDFIIPLEDLSTDATWYNWDTPSTPSVTVVFFAVMGSDGDPHVAFDACEVCYAAKAGYSQVGDLMHCNNCGNEYPINGIGTENTGTGCWPGYLPMTYDETEITILAEDLIAGEWFFD